MCRVFMHLMLRMLSDLPVLQRAEKKQKTCAAGQRS